MNEDPKNPEELGDSDLEDVAGGGSRKTGGGSGGGGGGGKGGGKDKGGTGNDPVDGDQAIDDILNT